MRKLLIIFLVVMSREVLANDPFFMQHYNSQLNLNPALTGINYGSIRLGLNYRNYLSSIDAIETYAFSVDMPFLENRLGMDFIGLGMVLSNDQSGHDYNQFKAMVSMAYHKAIGKSGNQFLSVGFQGGFLQTNSSFNNLSTQNQWVPYIGYDPLLNNGENLSDEDLLSVDAKAGLIWYGFFSQTSLFFGTSVNHFTRPHHSFSSSSYNLPFSYLLHGGGTFPLTSKINLNPGILWSHNAGLNLLNIGSQLEYNVSSKDEQFISLGIWSRNTDAVTASGGFEFNKLYICLSYDMMISELKDVTVNDGLEISLIYRIRKKINNVPNLMSDPNLHL